MQKLIRQLGDKDYFVRQRAETELAAVGADAFDALSDAAGDEDPEIAAHARHLLRLIRVEWSGRDDPKIVKDLLQDYATQSAENRRVRMAQLARLPGHAGAGALCRLARFERASVLSKQAALDLLGSVKPGEEPDARLAAAIQKSLGNCRRPVAAWLLTYTRMAKDPDAAAAAWTKLVEAEEALLKSGSTETSTEIVAAMLRFQVAWLKKTGRNEAAVAAIRRLIRLDVGDADSLIELVYWLNDQKAWQAVDELAARHVPPVAASKQEYANSRLSLSSVPMFRYAIAESQALRGNKEQAEKLAAEALALNPGKDDGACRAT